MQHEAQDIAIERLAAALADDDRTAVDEALRAAPPALVVAAAAGTLAPGWRSLPDHLADADPRVLTIRTIARMHRFDGSEPELGMRALEALTRLLAAKRWNAHAGEWAGYAAQHWLAWSLAWNEAGDCLPHVRQLVAARGERVRSIPLVAAACAASTTVAGDLAGAMPLWEAALAGTHAAERSDDWWSIRILHAGTVLLAAAPDIPQAITTLRRARDHFAARDNPHAERHFHDAASHLVVAQLLAGRTNEAAEDLRDAIAIARPGGSVRAHLQALRPLVHLRAGRTDAARRALAAVPRALRTEPLWSVFVTGPVELAVAAAAGDAHMVAVRIARLRTAELAHPAIPEYRVQWRFAAVDAAAATGDRDTAMALLDECDEVLAAHPNPLLDCWGAALRVEHGAADEHAARAISLAAQHGLEELLARGVAARGGVAAARLVLEQEATGRERLTASGILAHAGTGVPRQQQVRIKLLGGCRVWVGSEEMPVTAWQGRRQARLLLAALLVPQGTARHRDELADLLWGEIDPASIGLRIRPLLYTLRTALGAGSTAGEGLRHLANRGGSVSLVLAASDWCDVHDFLESVRTCMDPDTEAPTAITAGLHALSLYEGPFMAGEGFDEILTTTRDWLAERTVAVATRLSTLLEPGTTEAHRALAWIEWALAEEPERVELGEAIGRLSVPGRPPLAS